MIRRILRTIALGAVLSAGSFGWAVPASAAGISGPWRLSHPLAAFQSTRPNRVLANGTVNVLAIMVQFQKDEDSLTSGNGQFDMSNGSGLDAPPHNKPYFEDHLLFLKNYFYKVSGGKMNINYTVLDSVITLPHTMRYYSPPSSGSNSALGLLYEQSWQEADSIYRNFDFASYQCFVIFHAGSGRDINFTQTVGYDPFPYNIPSIYLNIKSLKAMFGSGYEGQSVDNGSFRIPNSIIMPESEHYFLLQSPDTLDFTLGTNGLLANSFGSFLGLPDLFDTKTGVTGIGTFGLMDGQSAFAFGGIFPPEPCAWEKAFLGWVKPMIVSPATATRYTLYANETGKYSALEVPISGSEYFLLENRERDALHNGEHITTVYDGATQSIVIPDGGDSAYFDGQQIHNINGVVTDADEYDWALPGYIDPNSGVHYYGGVLIWHIDENVINANLATNTVNADPSHRGVCLMEAHGANEIGRLIQDITGQMYYYEGSPFDFWFKGNTTVSYKNAFTPTSLPNSDSYSGADSHLYITNFSNADSSMTFDVMVGDSTVHPTAGFPKNIYDATANSSPAFGRISSNGQLQVIANNGDSLYAFNMNGTSATPDSTGLLSTNAGEFQPIVSSGQTGANPLYAMSDSTLYSFELSSGNVDTLFSTSATAGGTAAGLPLLQLGSKLVAFGRIPGEFSVFRTSGTYVNSYKIPIAIQVSGAEATGGSSAFGQFAALDTSGFLLNLGFANGVSKVNLDSLLLLGSSLTFPAPGALGPAGISLAVLAPDSPPQIVGVGPLQVALNYRSSPLQVPTKVFNPFPGDTIISGPVISDLDGDGSRDIIFATQTKVYAIQYDGAVLDGFPISTIGSEVLPSDANRIVGSIAVADLDGSGKPDIIFGTEGGEIYAFSGATAKIVPGFPLSVGSGLAGSPAVAYDSVSGNLYLAAISKNGHLYSWTFKGTSSSQIVWGNLLGDNYHTNAITTDLASQILPPSSTLMPADQVYNWPNPVTGGLTKIHFYLSTNAKVSVGIYSFAGSKVADFEVNGVGGMANEIDWNTGGVQSGVYFARVEAVSSNERDLKIIKIAVVK